LLFTAFEISERKFDVNRFNIGQRIDLVGDMNDIRVLEAANNVCDRICLADIGEKLIAETFALGCSGDQSGNVNELHRCWNRTFWLDECLDRFLSWIGH